MSLLHKTKYRPCLNKTNFLLRKTDVTDPVSNIFCVYILKTTIEMPSIEFECKLKNILFVYKINGPRFLNLNKTKYFFSKIS